MNYLLSITSIINIVSGICSWRLVIINPEENDVAIIIFFIESFYLIPKYDYLVTFF